MCVDRPQTAEVEEHTASGLTVGDTNRAVLLLTIQRIGRGRPHSPGSPSESPGSRGSLSTPDSEGHTGSVGAVHFRVGPFPGGPMPQTLGGGFPYPLVTHPSPGLTATALAPGASEQ